MSDETLGGTRGRRPSSGLILSGARPRNASGRSDEKYVNERIHGSKPHLSGERLLSGGSGQMPLSGEKLGQSGGTRASGQTVSDGIHENGPIQHGVKRRLNGERLLDGNVHSLGDGQTGQSDGIRASGQIRNGEKPGRSGGIRANRQNPNDENLGASIRRSVGVKLNDGSAPV